MILKKIIFFLSISIIFLCIQNVNAKSFEKLFNNDGKFLSLTPEKFMNNEIFHKSFKWVNQDKTNARYANSFKTNSITFFNAKLQEIIIFFEETSFKRADLSFFNKGDSEEKPNMKKFQETIEKLNKLISTWTGTNLKEAEVKYIAGNKIYQNVWNIKPFFAILTWSSTGKSKSSFVAEYIKLSLEPYKENFSMTAFNKTKKVKPLTKKELKKLLSKEDNGKILIKNIPMVDQGQKGYCVVATSARVFQYYGLTNVDQHLIAQLCESNGDKGTSSDIFSKNLKRLGFKFGVRFKEYFTANARDLIKSIEKYNSFVKRDKSKQIEYRTATQYFEWNHIFNNIKQNIEKYREFKITKEKGDYQRKFLRNIKKSIDEGIPIIWSVILGLVKEPQIPQSVGGHMRLIIGYNDTLKVIYYSDSWGARHELKTMPYDDAWIMTSGIFSFIPRK